MILFPNKKKCKQTLFTGWGHGLTKKSFISAQKTSEQNKLSLFRLQKKNCFVFKIQFNLSFPILNFKLYFPS